MDGRLMAISRFEIINSFFDILIVAYIIYRILILLKGPRAGQMMIGLLIVFALYIGSQFFNLITLQWLLNNFITSLFIVLVILFQTEIRRTLTHIGSAKFFKRIEPVENARTVEEVIKASIELRKRRLGAIIVLEKNNPLNEYTEEGTSIDSFVKEELIVSIFSKESPIHDGAVIIQGNKLSAAGCYLPLSMREDLARHFGTRHRAAIGLSEDTDAVVIVISEERGEISVAFNGEIKGNLDENQLRNEINRLLR